MVRLGKSRCEEKTSMETIFGAWDVFGVSQRSGTRLVTILAKPFAFLALRFRINQLFSCQYPRILGE